jgi:hypothetical protein
MIAAKAKSQRPRLCDAARPLVLIPGDGTELVGESIATVKVRMRIPGHPTKLIGEGVASVEVRLGVAGYTTKLVGEGVTISSARQ